MSEGAAGSPSLSAPKSTHAHALLRRREPLQTWKPRPVKRHRCPSWRRCTGGSGPVTERFRTVEAAEGHTTGGSPHRSPAMLVRASQAVV